MKYKLLCTDIDGTLLNDDKEVSKEDREALRWAYSQGIKIALVTSRMPTSTEPIARMLGIPCILASNGGSCILSQSCGYISQRNEQRGGAAYDL